MSTASPSSTAPEAETPKQKEAPEGEKSAEETKEKSISEQKKEAHKSVSSFLNSMSSLEKGAQMTNEKQIERLTTHIFANPYEVMMLSP